MLGAPLHNIFWSWGAVRETDGAVVLRAAQRDFIKGMFWLYDPADADRVGGRERLEHVRAIEAGATCYIVVYERTEDKNGDEVINKYNNDTLFVGTEITWRDGHAYLKPLKRVPSNVLMTKK